MHVLETSIHLPLPQERVFQFFADACNLARITPPAMGFQIVSPLPITMQQGTEIEYRIRLAGVPLRWRSLIARWEPPYQFVDQQLQGPYHTWIHTHRFHEENGGTRIEDHVQYRLPLEPIGLVALPFVRRQLKQIFAFREQAITQILLQ